LMATVFGNAIQEQCLGAAYNPRVGVVYVCKGRSQERTTIADVLLIRPPGITKHVDARKLKGQVGRYVKIPIADRVCRIVFKPPFLVEIVLQYFLRVEGKEIFLSRQTLIPGIDQLRHTGELVHEELAKVDSDAMIDLV